MNRDAEMEVAKKILGKFSSELRGMDLRFSAEFMTLRYIDPLAAQQLLIIELYEHFLKMKSAHELTMRLLDPDKSIERLALLNNTLADIGENVRKSTDQTNKEIGPMMSELARAMGFGKNGGQ